MRIVLDTDVLVASVRSKTGVSRYVVRLIENRRITALVTVSMVIEYESVLKRQEHLRAARMTVRDVDKFIGTLLTFMEPVTPYFMWRPQLRDPNDEMILEAAANGRADAIVTFNLRHYLHVVPRFGIQVLEPADLVRRLQL